MIRGADHLLRKHFGRELADDNVQILDPATGTGTFITNLIKFLPDDRLEHKYLNEIHANEVAILPYYIANLNIEYSYKERTGRYLRYPNLCFVDTSGQHGLGRARRHGWRGDPPKRVQLGRTVHGQLDTCPVAEREADQRHHRQSAVQRQSTATENENDNNPNRRTGR